MSIYEAASAMKSVLGSITAPSTPTVRIVPPGHGDDRHASRPAECWINLELGEEEHVDETSASDLVIYTVRFHGWTAANNRALEHQAMAADVGAMEAAAVQLGQLLAGLLVAGEVAQLFLGESHSALRHEAPPFMKTSQWVMPLVPDT